MEPGPDNPLGDRWIGWSLKGFGFHSTIAPNSIGSAASHGCVRLYPEAAHLLFDLVKKGDAISWSCTYDNQTGKTLHFGDSASTNEMCILVGIYYPAPNSQTLFVCNK